MTFPTDNGISSTFCSYRNLSGDSTIKVKGSSSHMSVYEVKSKSIQFISIYKFNLIKHYSTQKDTLEL
jgi:hypothetical protein